MESKKIVSITIVLLLTSLCATGQCRLTRYESSDSSITGLFYYDSLGRLGRFKEIYRQKTDQDYKDVKFTYQDSNQLASFQVFRKDTLTESNFFLYEKKRIIQQFRINSKNDTIAVRNFEYNDQNQLTNYRVKNPNGDTTHTLYEYAPEGWLKRLTRLSNDNFGSMITEYFWNLEEKIVDDPARIFFGDYPINPFYNLAIPVASLSVKGNFKGSVRYEMPKNGQNIKTQEDEIFDVKANKLGLWTENKYKLVEFPSQDTSIMTFYAFYEGCKTD
jgi:hypothetical protein